ncbi:hypothetical protein GW846_02300 [Candidatus Gracilibacteria bacterium]|nr:hypothetical protein [Candidatus Gracilibacteria bacterium]
MKKILIALTVLLAIVPFQSIFAFNENISFNNYTIISELDTIDKEVDVRIEYALSKKPINSYATIVTINGKTYQQNLKYNSLSTKLYADISTRYVTVPSNLDYKLSVIDENSFTKFTASGSLSIKTGTITQNPKPNTPTSNNPNTPLSSEQQSALTASRIIIANIKTQYSTDATRVSALVREIALLKERRLQYPSRVNVFNLVIIHLENEIRSIYGLTPTTNNLTIPKSPTTNNYTPKYTKPSEEPTRINGIGNAKSYDSWRVSQ